MTILRGWRYALWQPAQLQNGLGDPRIEVSPRQAPNVLAYFFLQPGCAIRTVRPQRIPDVDHRKNPRCQGYGFAAQAAWVARAIPLLVVTVRNFQCRAQVGDG